MGRLRGEFLSTPLSSIYNIIEGHKSHENRRDQYNMLITRRMATIIANTNRKENSPAFGEEEIFPLPYFDEHTLYEKKIKGLSDDFYLFVDGILDFKKEKNLPLLQDMYNEGMFDVSQIEEEDEIARKRIELDICKLKDKLIEADIWQQLEK